MKVELINWTLNPERVIAIASRQCYSGINADEIGNGMTDESMGKFVKKLANTGHTPIEHAIFTFTIDGLSRAGMAQLTRHRLASFNVSSQRYISHANFEYVTPPSITENSEAKAIYDGIMKELDVTYKKLQDMGVKNEDARFILPNACTTRIICTMNARSLMHFFNLRCCCYDDKTEVLTTQGWKSFNDVTTDDLFYSLNDEQEVKYVKPNNIICESYSGDMYSIQGQSIDLLITPNHNVYYSSSYENKKYQLDEIQNVAKLNKVLFKKNCHAISGKKEEWLLLPRVVQPKKNQYKEFQIEYLPRTIPMQQFLQFLGMWIGDGWTTKTGQHYNIGIAKGDYNKIKKYAEILQSLTLNSVRIYQDKRGSWKLNVHDRQLYELLHPISGAQNKKIFDWIFELDYSLLQYLWQGLLDSDFNSSGTTYTTISKKLSDDVQRLALHLGWSATIGISDRRGQYGGTIVNRVTNQKRRIVSKNLCYCVNINRAKNEPIVKNGTSKNNIFLSSYQGQVHCVELPCNHTLYVRRNGKCVWAGNSRAQWEIRELANEMLRLVKYVAPNLFAKDGAHCEQYGVCLEEHSCGRVKGKGVKEAEK